MKNNIPIPFTMEELNKIIKKTYISTKPQDQIKSQTQP